MRKLIFLFLVALFAAYAGWAERRPAGHYLSDLRAQVVSNLGTPSGQGNLLGIQPALFTEDYQSVQRLRLKLQAALRTAREQGLIGPRTIVVFPEHIGTWLFIRGEKPEVYQSHTAEEAMTWMAASNPLKLARNWLIAKAQPRTLDALLRMKAVDMAENYQTLFGGLAKEFGVTLVAGSIVLPNPKIIEGQLRTGNGHLYNVSQVFSSDGQPLGEPQRQLYPEAEAEHLIRSGDLDDLQVINTPAGRLAVLFHSDSTHAGSYAALAKHQPQIIALPAFFNTTGQVWSNNDSPRDFPQSSARVGIRVAALGHLWELGSRKVQGTQLINLWL